jgi:hypothetical protein
MDLPPVVADRKTKKITNGFHRVTAYQKAYGSAVLIPVIWKDYTDEAEMWADAVKMNGAQGLGLGFSVFDMGRIVMQGKEFDVDTSIVAKWLYITEAKAESLLKNTVLVEDSTLAGAEIRVPIKKGMDKLASQERITQAQMEANDQALGVRAIRLANDLLARITTDSIYYSEDFLFVLEKLRDAIDGVLLDNAR